MKVAGRYELLEVLGQGGTGRVWHAHDETLGREVAVKQVQIPLGVSDAERDAMKQRVMREAQAAARIGHAGAATVFDVVSDEGVPYIVMELVVAPTLSELVERDGPLEPRRAATIGLLLADVLASAHQQGIIHRDVKASNVMVPAEGMAKLTDFGIASLVDSPRLTQTGLALGSPAYMSPEQANGAVAGPAADLWGLGVTLYFAVEGELPFQRDSTIATVHAVVNDPPRITQRAGDLEPVLERLLVKDPDARPSVQWVRSRLSEIADGNVERRRAGGAAAAGAAAAGTTAAAASSAPAATTPSDTVDERGPADTRPAVDDPDTSMPAAAEAAGTDSSGPSSAARTAWLLVGGAVVALVLAVAIVAALLAGDDPSPATDDVAPPPATAPAPATTGEATEPTPPPTEPTASPTAPTASPTQPTEPTAGAVPPDWVPFEPDGAPYSVAHPPGWQPEPGEGNQVDIVDPETGAYLRVAWTDTPEDDPVQDWLNQEESFSARFPDYERIALEPADFRGAPAAHWEYVYSDGGAALHAINFNISMPEYGYALNYQTSAGQWEQMSGLFETFRTSFEPAG